MSQGQSEPVLAGEPCLFDHRPPLSPDFLWLPPRFRVLSQPLPVVLSVRVGRQNLQGSGQAPLSYSVTEQRPDVPFAFWRCRWGQIHHLDPSEYVVEAGKRCNGDRLTFEDTFNTGHMSMRPCLLFADPFQTPIIYPREVALLLTQIERLKFPGV